MKLLLCYILIYNLIIKIVFFSKVDNGEYIYFTCSLSFCLLTQIKNIV